MHDDVREPLAARLDPAGVEHARELLAGQAASSTERFREPRVGAAEERRVELELPVHVPVHRVHARTGEGEQPAEILRRDEVPGRPHHVRADEGAGVERAVEGRVGGVPRPEGERPLRAGVVLRLDGAEPPHRVGGRVERRADEALIAEAVRGDVHLRVVSSPSTGSAITTQNAIPSVQPSHRFPG